MEGLVSASGSPSPTRAVRVRPPVMWLSRARTSYSGHGVGRPSWSWVTAATVISVWAMARRCSGRGSMFSVMRPASSINLTTNVIFPWRLRTHEIRAAAGDAAAPAGARPGDRGRAGGAARGLDAHRVPGRRGAVGGRGAGLRRARAGRRDPAAAGVPHRRDRADRGRGTRAVRALHRRSAGGSGTGERRPFGRIEGDEGGTGPLPAGGYGDQPADPGRPGAVDARAGVNRAPRGAAGGGVQRAAAADAVPQRRRARVRRASGAGGR